MPTLTRRTPLLLDEERHERLAREAEASGASVGELIRRAIDLAYPKPAISPREAADRLLAAPPMPVEDWPEMKRKMLDERARVKDYPDP